MLHKSLLISGALLLLIALFAVRAPQAQAAQSRPQQMEMTATPMAMPMEMGDDAEQNDAEIEHEDTAMPMNLSGTAEPDGMDGMAGMSMGGARIDANGATVKIVSPADGDTITGNSVMVKVETTKLALGADGVHFHLNVDGAEQGMSQGNSVSLMAHDLTPGEHTLEVVLANGQHQELDASDMIKVNVQAASAAAPAAGNTALYIIVAVAALAVLGGGAFLLMRRPKA